MNEEKQQNWEQDLIHKLAFAALKEQRKSRRWGIFFKLIFLLYVTILFIAYLPGENTGKSALPVGKHTALIDLSGVIADDADASADLLVTGMREALEDKKSQALIIRANSPGGSPVQADYVYREIIRLREKYPEKPIYAVITDVCASACYYIISATDKIFANEASLVGSIGVLTDGFGFVGTMEKLGIERRLYTAGEHKGTLDPFSPENPQDVAHMKSLLKEVHQQFIDAVKSGRGERLKPGDELFSGLFWSGARAKNMGLVDDFASPGTVARDVVGAEELVDYTPSQSLLDRLIDRLGASIASTVLPQSQLRLR